jgi:hypothetical protein
MENVTRILYSLFSFIGLDIGDGYELFIVEFAGEDYFFLAWCVVYLDHQLEL